MPPKVIKDGAKGEQEPPAVTKTEATDEDVSEEETQDDPSGEDPSSLSVKDKARRFSTEDPGEQSTTAKKTPTRPPNADEAAKRKTTSKGIVNFDILMEVKERNLDHAFNDLRTELSEDEIDEDNLNISWSFYSQNYKEYKETNLRVQDQFLKDRNQPAFMATNNQLQRYTRMYLKLEHQVKKIISVTSTTASRSSISSPDSVAKIRYPKRELPKFTGEVREWLAFKAAFETIDKDKGLTVTDKFHYLIQSTKEESAARKLLNSFPFSEANYKPAYKSLEERFGRPNVLVKVYVRDLLQMVIENSTGKKMDFQDLVTNITSQIRNLESLGVTQDKSAQVLYPVVESCLPQDVLQAWQRSTTYKEELDKLIEFLQTEVNSFNERNLAQFQIGQNGNRSPEPSKNNGSKDAKQVKTAAGFLNTSGQKEAPKCLFCERTGHVTAECFTAIKMDLEKRKAIVKENNSCPRCIKKHRGKCNAKLVCLICGQGHHPLMCFRGGKSEKIPAIEKSTHDEKEKAATPSTSTGISGASTPDNSTTTMSNVVSRPEVLLQTLTVNVHGPAGIRKVRAAYDSLSQSSYLKEEIASQLELPKIGQEKVVHQTFGGNLSRPQQHNIYKIALSGLLEKNKFNYEISGIPKISGAIDRLPPGEYLNECVKNGITLTDHESPSEEIELLIGADFGDDLKLGGKFIKLKAGPVAVHTKVGWVLSGSLNSGVRRGGKLSMMHLDASLSEKGVSTLWSLESIGITDPAESKSRKEIEESAIDHFKKTVTQDETGRYAVQLPWIEGHPELPNNHAVALSRLQSTTRKLKTDGLLEAYDGVFKTWLTEGIIEIPPPSDNSSQFHYLPHRAVVKENSTTPIRPVFDASAKSKDNPSFNDCQEKGPNLLELIPTLQTRFRLDKFGVVADIKKAFQQIGVHLQDRDKMRFLWWKDTGNCKEVMEYRHARVVFGVSSSPFLLGATLKHHVDQFPKYEDTKEMLRSCFYVDNAVVSLPTMEAAMKFKTEAVEILATGQFDLRGWEIGPTAEEKTVAVLGLLWNLKEDTLKFDVKRLISNTGVPATKRNLYMLHNMLYDPLGFASPFTVCGKILLKKVCLAEKIGWDEPLSAEHSREFDRWKKQFVDLEKIIIPRFIEANLEGAKYSLHCCVDASQDCFACCVYLRVDDGRGVRVHLVHSKTRVSPKKGATIPRLELLSCLIGARLVVTVLQDLGSQTDTLADSKKYTVFYWTDSTTALTWIQRQDAWATFVNNRVTEIRKLSDPARWAHIPGAINPADLLSRGCTVKKLIESKWWSGPSWLYQPESDWHQRDPHPNEDEVNKEKRKTVISAVNNEIGEPPYLDEAFLRCGSFAKLLRVITYIIRFVNWRRKKPPSTYEITAEEADTAETYLLRYIQKTMNVKEMKLPTVKDESGLLRLKSRLTYGEDAESFKFPALLPGKHPIVKLLVQHEHELLHHAGVQYVQSHLRERYWITNSRRAIRNVIHSCAVCRRHVATRCQVPESSLPADRVNVTRVFQVTGIDVTGPLFVEKDKKVWVVLFTCAVYRAVHLELVESLSTEAFLQAFQKFVARRGRPVTIYSDNGTNFTGANNLLRSVKWEDILRYATIQKIRWRYNPPSAAWWGGWWERLIGLMKNIMRRVLGNRFIRKAQLEVLLTEVESIMNDRPLTYISDDPDDLRPLTPSSFLRDLPVAALPEIQLVDGKAFRINMKKSQKMKEELRQRFRREYLGHLVDRGKNEKTMTLTPGSVVLVELDNHKRMDWPMGIILETFLGKDGESRVARIKTNKGILVRPLQRLFPLEVPTKPANENREAI